MNRKTVRQVATDLAMGIFPNPEDCDKLEFPEDVASSLVDFCRFGNDYHSRLNLLEAFAEADFVANYSEEELREILEEAVAEILRSHRRRNP